MALKNGNYRSVKSIQFQFYKITMTCKGSDGSGILLQMAQLNNVILCILKYEAIGVGKRL